jgi:hypothetical protein
MFLLNGNPLPLDVPFTTPEGIQYPANWLRLATLEEKEAIGITEAPEPAIYDQRFYWGYDQDGQLLPKQLEDEEVTPEEGDPYTTTGLKSLWINQTKETANSLLQPTDWMIVREFDNGTAVDPEVKQRREDIRVISQNKIAYITALTTVEELASYVTGQKYNRWEVVEDQEPEIIEEVVEEPVVEETPTILDATPEETPAE